MAVGETSGQGGPQGRVVVGRGPPPPAAEGAPPTTSRRGRRPLVKEADPELERLLAEEEDIERRIREHHETPQFQAGDE